MSQTLDEFLTEARDEINRFEKTWREKNAKDPEAYPMALELGNEGLWWEFFEHQRSIW